MRKKRGNRAWTNRNNYENNKKNVNGLDCLLERGGRLAIGLRRHWIITPGGYSQTPHVYSQAPQAYSQAPQALSQTLAVAG